MDSNQIEKYFKNRNLDIRKCGNNPRFLDQKCAPDVVSFIADCILQIDKERFDRNDIWNNKYFIKNASHIFGKPSPNNKAADSEYDKFILQPLDMLSYAKILDKQKKSNRNVFIIKRKDILEYIAMNERNTFNFMFCYLDKFIKDSNFNKYVDLFMKNQNKKSFDELKRKFIQFMRANSEIGSRNSSTGGALEIRRIFPKIINVFAVKDGKKGTQKGTISSGQFLFADLMYNQINFRDMKKSKNITLAEEIKAKYSKPNIYQKFQMQKAMKWIKQHHPYSEVEDRLYGATAEVHHIFPKSQFPKISYYIENLIALTAGQHKDLAHPKGNSTSIDSPYQQACLRAKKKTIETQINKGETQYSMPNFIFVLSDGFKKTIPVNANSSEIDEYINQYYLEN
ncbi:MAG: hypothetical protein LBT79_03335 [Elusimicrobiota bacterium]|jgi:hypothetical protein|nr:hypothetical protein [Elusimicrobiota bacterium]